MNSNNLTINEATQEAAQEHVTAHELDILVSKTREKNLKRDRDIAHMESVLNDVESRLTD